MVDVLPAAESAEVGTVKQLLVDDHVVEKLSGLTRVVQQPQRISDQPILAAEHPWEGKVLQMPSVLWDPRLSIFHMYYWAVAGDSIYTCYARSADGERWEKPKLNLHAGQDGSKENNIVLRGEGRVARTRYVVLNPGTGDLQRRFLALYIDNVPGLTEFAASSPDGLHWTTEKKIGDLRHVSGGSVTPDPPFFLMEAGMNFVSPEIVAGDRMLFYYSGWKKEHSASDNEAAIGLATLPVDRFVAVEPIEQRGSLTTKPFTMKGEQLRVNADAADGELRVEVLDEQSRPISGCNAASCEPISADALRAEVKWRGGSLRELKGQKIHLRFQLTRAKLFAFQVQ